MPSNNNTRKGLNSANGKKNNKNKNNRNKTHKKPPLHPGKPRGAYPATLQEYPPIPRGKNTIKAHFKLLPRNPHFGEKIHVPLNTLKKMVFGKEEPKSYEEIIHMTPENADKWFATLSEEEYDNLVRYF